MKTGVKAALLAVTLGVLVSGCGSSHHTGAGKFPVVVAHPKVQTSGVPAVKLTSNQAKLLAPAQVVFITTGTTSCVWLPTRLTALSGSTVQIDMRVNGAVAACGSGAAAFPIAVTVDPKVVDVHHALTIRLAYKVRLPREGAVHQWERTIVAPALGGS